jgi:hypothetical protein
MDILQKIETYLKVYEQGGGGAGGPGPGGGTTGGEIGGGTTTKDVAQYAKKIPFGMIRRRKRIHKPK